ncbi:hypothetical protein [Spirillospora sp. NPDC047279]|uniref:hypothetical protein n=1 Tax=Spirillospora sp. NPDC047279 TaxID=3155478 RepID=UPI0033D01B01
MRLVYALLAALGIVLAGLVVSSVVVLMVGGKVTDWPRDVATVLFVHVPWVVTFGVAAVVAGAIHRGGRTSPAHLIAVFGVPVLACVLSVWSGIASDVVAGGLLSAAEAAVGAVGGWLVSRHFARQNENQGYLPAY